MRPNYIPVIVVGVMLLYLGIFGIEGFGFQWTATTLPTTEEFNDYVGWSPYEEGGAPRVIINPASQAEFSAKGSTTTQSRDSLVCFTPGGAVQGVSTFTISMRMQFNDIGSTTAPFIGSFSMQWYDYSWWYYTDIRADGVINIPGATGAWTPNTNWHTWTFCNTRTGTASVSVAVYLDATKLFTLQSASAAASPKISLDCFNQAIVHVDWVKVVSGIVDPSQPTTGTLTVTATKDGSPVSGAYISITGPTPKTDTTGTSGTCSWSDLSPGSYSVSGTYNSVTKTGVPSPVSVTVSTPATSAVDFTSTIPGTGTITVTCLDVYGNALSGIEISATRTSGPTTKQTTGASGIATFVNLQYSTYTISATFNNEAKTDTKTISSTSPSASVQFQFSTEKQEPSWWDKFVETLRTVVNTVKMPLTIFGGLITAVGSIMMVLPAKAYRPTPRPSIPSYS